MFKDESNKKPEKDFSWICIKDYMHHIIKLDNITIRRVISLALLIETIHYSKGHFFRIVNLDNTLHGRSFHYIVN